jgi:hypothetical protein
MTTMLVQPSDEHTLWDSWWVFLLAFPVVQARNVWRYAAQYGGTMRRVRELVVFAPVLALCAAAWVVAWAIVVGDLSWLLSRI